MQLSVHYDFEKTGSLEPINGQGPTLPLVRASDAQIIDRGGWLKYVTDDIPRMYGAYYSDNILIKSEDQLDITNWGNGGSGLVRTGGQLDPWGTFKAVELRDDARGGTFVTRIQQETAHDGNGAYLYAWYLKAVEGASNDGWVSMSLQNTGGTPASPAAFFNVAEGYVGSAPNVYDAKIVPVANGFYRCSFVVDMKDGDGSSTWLLSVADGDGDGVLTMDGTNAIICVGAHASNVSGLWRRQNLFLYSDDFSVVNWGPLNVTKTPNAVIAPDDTKSAVLITAVNGGGVHRLSQSRPLNSRDGFLSWYAKAEGHPFIQLLNGAAAGQYANFDLVNGVVAASGSLAEYVGMKRVKNGFYHCWVKLNKIPIISSNWYVYMIPTATAGYGASGSFDGASVALWHPQLEVSKPNQTKPTDYIGTIQTAEFEYDVPNYLVTDTERVSFVTGPCDGYFPENTRTNLFLRSNELSEVASAWNTPVNGATPDADVEYFIDGTKSMDRLVDSGLGGTGAVRFGQNVTVATSTRYAASFWFKADQLDWAYIRAIGFTTPATSIAYFDLANGVPGTKDAGFAFSGMENWGNGLYRCWVTFDTDAVDTIGTIQIGPANADLDDVVDLDGTSSIFAGGAQFEAGYVISGYMPTAGATSNRAADQCFTTDVSDFNADGSGVWYARGKYTKGAGLGGNTSDYGVFQLYDTTVKRVPLYANNGAPLFTFAADDGVAPSITMSTSPKQYAADEDFSVCVSVARQNDSVLYTEGVFRNTDTSYGPFDNLTPSNFSMGSGTLTQLQYWHGLIKEFRYYRGFEPERMNDDLTSKLSLLPGDGQITPGYDPRRKQKAIDAALWNKAMNQRTREARGESDDDFTPFNNVG